MRINLVILRVAGRCGQGGFAGRAAPCTRRSAGRWPATSIATSTSTATAEAGFLRVGGVGPVAGDAVNPSLGAWPRHPCRGHPRNRTHPAFDRFPRSVGKAWPALGGCRPWSTGRCRSTPRVDAFRSIVEILEFDGVIHAWRGPTRSRETVRGGAVSECGVSAAWMPRPSLQGRTCGVPAVRHRPAIPRKPAVAVAVAVAVA